MNNKLLIAIVGMPGAGKSEVVKHLQSKSMPFVRFGDITEEEVSRLGLELTPANEKTVREQIRKEKGMSAFAVLAQPQIEEKLQHHDIVVIDGLYSWEEYVFLKEKYPNLLLIHVYAEPPVRYQRLARREVRPVPQGESRERDIAEIENLNKGGSIAIADYIIENNSENVEELYSKIDLLLKRLQV